MVYHGVMVHAGDTKLTMKKKLKFSWSSVLDRRERRSQWVKDAFVFEIAEVLVLQALQTSNAASNVCVAGDYSTSKNAQRSSRHIGLRRRNTLAKVDQHDATSRFEVEASV